ncbi:MAG: HD domain-containing protein [Candidatus Methanofastidiosum sp.]|nr:HD domain-containing protein [Methanofastidiosum sp.]
MIRKSLLLRIFDSAYMQRWNDKIRPLELVELDKQGHKMIIAYVLGKYEEKKSDFSWIDIIEGGIFELLQRIVITDLKPTILYEFKKDEDKYRKLNQWVFKELEPVISPLGTDFSERFRAYFNDSDDTLNKRVLSGAHFYATRWEFDIIKQLNTHDYEMIGIERDLQQKQNRYYDLEGIKAGAYTKFGRFISFAGQLRFQARWAHVHRVPKTSVLGHMMFVAILSYLFSLEIDACEKRRVNNFFTGLFHDLPEVLTKDIHSPLKRSVEGLEGLIKGYEKEQMEEKVYPLIPKDWHDQLRMFTENEFENIIHNKGKPKIIYEDIESEFNFDKYSPRDGKLIKAIDKISAFIEAYEAIKNGSASPELHKARWSLKFESEKNPINSGINFGEIYADFD